jgi:hypothetical protein
MHPIDHPTRLIDRRLWQDSVTQVEYVPGPMPRFL